MNKASMDPSAATGLCLFPGCNTTLHPLNFATHFVQHHLNDNDSLYNCHHQKKFFRQGPVSANQGDIFLQWFRSSAQQHLPEIMRPVSQAPVQPTTATTASASTSQSDPLAASTENDIMNAVASARNDIHQLSTALIGKVNRQRMLQYQVQEMHKAIVALGRDFHEHFARMEQEMPRIVREQVELAINRAREREEANDSTEDGDDEPTLRPKKKRACRQEPPPSQNN